MRKFLVSLSSVIVLGAAAIYAGPLSSGALFLMAPASSTPVDHRMPPSYEALHKGGVDTPTGLYTREDEDLIVPDAVPLVLRRTYLSGDRVSRQFGIGATHPGEWYLMGDRAALKWAELILADGGRIRFHRVSSGSSFATALFEHRNTPTFFFGSRLGWVGLRWALRFADGSLALFQACGQAPPTTCSLIELRDTHGHRIRYVRDRSGLLLRIQGPTRQIAFDYDARRRIVRAYESPTTSVSYSYDAGGRLSRVVESDGTIRSYTYSARDEMIAIHEPGWDIRNTFDDRGRVVRQVTQLSDSKEPITFQFAYTVSNGSVVQTDMTRNGLLTRYTYSSEHYVLSKIVDPDGPNPISVELERSAATNLISALTVRCTGRDGHVIRNVAASSGDEDAIARELIEEECR